MRNIKAIITYSLISALSLAALAGHFFPQIGGTGISTSLESPLKKSSDALTNAQTGGGKSGPLPGNIAREPVVGVGRGEDHSKATREAIENAGGLKKLIKKGSTVLLKPNLITYFDPLKGENSKVTDYRVVQEVANLVRELGAAKVIVAEASPAGNMFARSGYDRITGVELVDMNKFGKEDCLEIKPEKSLTGNALFIPKLYLDADIVITIAKLKTHGPANGVTLSLKNSMGIPPTPLYSGGGSKNQLHSMGLHQVIVDLNKIRLPDFAVIDGITGGEGLGPVNTTPVKSNIIFAGSDLVALDTAALHFMGFTLDEVKYVNMAAQEGLGISDLDKIKVNGADLNAIKMRFQKPGETRKRK